MTAAHCQHKVSVLQGRGLPFCVNGTKNVAATFSNETVSGMDSSSPRGSDGITLIPPVLENADRTRRQKESNAFQSYFSEEYFLENSLIEVSGFTEFLERCKRDLEKL